MLLLGLESNGDVARFCGCRKIMRGGGHNKFEGHFGKCLVKIFSSEYSMWPRGILCFLCLGTVVDLRPFFLEWDQSLGLFLTSCLKASVGFPVWCGTNIDICLRG